MDVHFDLETHETRMRRDGFTVIKDFLPPNVLAEVRSSLEPHLGHHRGRNDFEGFATERVYTLVARGPVFEDIVEDPRLMRILDRFLLPGYLLSASQAICIYPGESAQGVHIDDGFYRQPRPRPACSISLIAAVDAFTAENGGTEVIPGSHLWSQAQVDTLTPEAAQDLLVPMVIPAGAAIVFQGNLLHQGGANHSEAPRLAFTNQYCEPWGRTQENFFLGVPREQAARMSPRVQALLGYSIWPPFMGHVTASHPLKALEPDWEPPAAVQARQGGGVHG